jgi:hypothetical protein
MYDVYVKLPDVPSLEYEGSLFQWGKAPGAWTSLPSSAEARNEWSYTSSPSLSVLIASRGTLLPLPVLFIILDTSTLSRFCTHRTAPDVLAYFPLSAPRAVHQSLSKKALVTRVSRELSTGTRLINPYPANVENRVSS